MILKKFRAHNPEPLCDYVFGPGRKNQLGRATVVAGTLAGRNAKTLAAELAALSSLRPDVWMPILHYSISLHPDDRELSSQEVEALGQDLADTFEIESWVILFHSDTPGRLHWHWIGSRIGTGTGDDRASTYLAREHLRDYKIAMAYARRWERQLGLRDVQSPKRPDRPHGRSIIPKKTIRADREARNRGKPLGRDLVRAKLDAVEAMGLRGEALRRALMDAGLDLNLRIAAGRPKGITWLDQAGGKWKGSDLGRRYAAKEWCQRNDLFGDEGGDHGRKKGTAVLPGIEDHPFLDAGDRGGHLPGVRTKHAGTGDPLQLDRRLERIGRRTPIHRHQSADIGPVNSDSPLSHAGAAGQGATQIVLRAIPGGSSGACGVDGARAAISSGPQRVSPDGSDTGRVGVACSPLGQTESGRLDEVYGGIPTPEYHGPGGGEGLDLGSDEVQGFAAPDRLAATGAAGAGSPGISEVSGCSAAITPARKRGR